MSNSAEILIEALLTEKATLLSASNKYLFKVHSQHPRPMFPNRLNEPLELR